MKSILLSAVVVAASGGVLTAADTPAETFHAYADSDICARLMVGLIDGKRIGCSQSTVKDGAQPVLVRLENNMVLEVNKTKMIAKIPGQFLQATGQVKPKDGTMKLAEVSPEEAKDIPAGAARRLIDGGSRVATSPKTYEKVRHELAMMPYISNFDFISFSLQGTEVILTGWTVRTTNRSSAQNVVKQIEGVTSIVNNIEVLPLGSIDMQIRANARTQLQSQLSRYFWSNGSDIKIIVQNGDILLLGMVSRKEDSDMATLVCNRVRGAHHVFNLLRVGETAKKG